MSELEKVYKQIESKRDEIIDFVKSMIQARPVNPAYSKVDDERECQRIIADRLTRIKNIQMDEFDISLEELEEFRDKPGFTTGFTDKMNFENRPNILACLPGSDSENARSIILTGHSDVVAADNEEEWTYPPLLQL
ncbi:hypothetical protein ACI2OX_19240 [Bacillus sp. N9]